MHQAVSHGARRARYRGLPRTRLDHIYMACALNLLRLHAYWTGTPLDRQRTSHLARLELSLAALPELTTRIITADKSGGMSPVAGFRREDCLYLDVYRPSGAAPGARLPVLVWFHGGGWTQGTGVIYGGPTMARLTSTIVISINYPLGALGWLALPQLDREQPVTLSGNYGMLDQIQALKWVRENASRFGGDPRDVTIDGQSAGADAVCTMLASPLARGLFTRAIIQSLGCAQSALSPQAQEKTSRQFAADAGCADAATMVSCLRSAWAPNLIAAQQKVNAAQPAYGTPVLPALPSAALASGRWNKVPVLIGGVRREGKLVRHRPVGPDR